MTERDLEGFCMSLLMLSIKAREYCNKGNVSMDGSSSIQREFTNNSSPLIRKVTLSPLLTMPLWEGDVIITSCFNVIWIGVPRWSRSITWWAASVFFFRFVSLFFLLFYLFVDRLFVAHSRRRHRRVWTLHDAEQVDFFGMRLRSFAGNESTRMTWYTLGKGECDVLLTNIIQA